MRPYQSATYELNIMEEYGLMFKALATIALLALGAVINYVFNRAGKRTDTTDLKFEKLLDGQRTMQLEMTIIKERSLTRPDVKELVAAALEPFKVEMTDIKKALAESERTAQKIQQLELKVGQLTQEAQRHA